MNDFTEVSECCDTADMPDIALITKKVKTKARKSYNSACLALLMQFGIATLISTVITAVYTAVMVVIALSATSIENVAFDQIIAASLNPTFLLATTAVSYLIANIASFFIGNAMTKRHHNVRLFGKIRLKPLDVLLSVVSVVGIQMLSALVQFAVVLITGHTGMNETDAGLLSFSDNILQNILLVVYTVIIAAVTEELLCRGAVMKGLSPISPTFGLIASSLLFGLMHGNFNQMFNGFLLGMVIGYAALKSKSLFLPIILHMAANGHAMFWSFIETRFGEEIFVAEIIYMSVVALIGIGAAVWLVIRNGLPDDKVDGYPVISTIDGIELVESKKGMTWKNLIKSPAFWLLVLIYGGTALMSITAIA